MKNINIEKNKSIDIDNIDENIIKDIVSINDTLSVS
jgi:hypothetical protein